MMKHIEIKNSMKDSDYTKLCNRIEKQGKLVACGSPEGKWILVEFEDEMDSIIWMLSMTGFAQIKN